MSKRGPELLVLVVGGIVGLLLTFLSPPWASGADEATHFARALDMAHGNLFPGTHDGQVGSLIPSSYTRDQNRITSNFLVTSPWGGGLLGDLLDSHPNWDDTTFIDTQPTTAATPVAYGPSALGMVIPNAVGAPGVVVVWCGRLADLLVYLALAVFAVRAATAFRWTLALTALFPLNLAIGASVTPDSVTVGALLLALAVWTRVWRPAPVPDAPARLHAKEADAALPGMRPWWTTALWVGGSGLLLALAKPPYFLVLAAFPALLLVRWRDLHVRVAAAAASGAALIGLAVTLLTTSGTYQSVTVGAFDTITYQPDVQRQRLLDDPFGFLGRVLGNWFSSFPDSVQRWTRQLGYWRSGLPEFVPWLVLIAFVVAAMVLDRDDLLALRRLPRAIFALGTAALLLVLYVSSYIYFDDTLDGKRMGNQITRYALPLFGMAVMGWAPRWPLRPKVPDPRLKVGALATVVVLEGVAAGAIIVTWLWTGMVKLS